MNLIETAKKVEALRAQILSSNNEDVIEAYNDYQEAYSEEDCSLQTLADKFSEILDIQNESTPSASVLLYNLYDRISQEVNRVADINYDEISDLYSALEDDEDTTEQSYTVDEDVVEKFKKLQREIKLLGKQFAAKVTEATVFAQDQYDEFQKQNLSAEDSDE